MLSFNRLNRLSQLSPSLMTIRSASTFNNQKYGKNIVLIEGIRTPFAQSNTSYSDLMAYELQRSALLYEIII
jgi:hypothetical protein